MLETYRYLVKYTDKKNLELSNEELVEMYKNSKNENDRSQAYSSLFVKNFAMMLRISNKCNFIESYDKAGMISEELIKSINDYNGTTKFITYLTNRINNLFFWEYSKRRSEINALNNSISMDELTSDSDNLTDGHRFEIMSAMEDKSQKTKIDSVLFITTLNKMFELEIKEHSSGSKYDKAYLNKLELSRKVINLLFTDDKLVNSQIARLLGMFVKDKNDNYIYINKPNAPDYKRIECVDVKGNKRIIEEEITLVKKSKWYTIDKINKFIRDLFLKYKINELS